MSEETKRFHVRTILSVTTGRLVTLPDGDGGNGIGDIYEILGWMTNDSPFSHQLGRFGEECKPWLLRWFPELQVAGLKSTLKSLDRWCGATKDGSGEGVKMWLTQLRETFPEIRVYYEVPKIPADDHEKKHPYDELVAMRGTDEGIIVIET